MNKNIIIEGNTIYELDPECLQAGSSRKREKDGHSSNSGRRRKGRKHGGPKKTA